MILKQVIFCAALIFCMAACNEPTPETAPDYDSVTAIPDKYTIPAEPATNHTETAAPTTDASQINAQDTLFEDGSVPATWANAGFDDPAGFKTFVSTFKDWVKTDNVDSIAANISFPIKPAKTAAVFKEKYAGIFDEKLKSTVASQRLDRIFRSADGAMIGNGQIWFTVNKSGYVITAINKN